VSAFTLAEQPRDIEPVRSEAEARPTTEGRPAARPLPDDGPAAFFIDRRTLFAVNDSAATK
jgi:hypothetical protein